MLTHTKEVQESILLLWLLAYCYYPYASNIILEITRSHCN